MVKPSRRPGRPPSETARRAILDAAGDLIESGGIGAVTMEAVARRAGVGKPTVYRNWPSREALAMAALMQPGAPMTDVAPSASALDDLARQLANVARVFARPRGRNALLMVASSDPDSELAKAFRNQVMQRSRDEGRGLILRAQAEELLKPDLAMETALDMIYGPVFFRLLMGHGVVDDAFVAALLRQVIDGLGVGSMGP